MKTCDRVAACFQGAARICPIDIGSPQSLVERSKMLYLPEKPSLLAKMKKRGLSGAFLG